MVTPSPPHPVVSLEDAVGMLTSRPTRTMQGNTTAGLSGPGYPSGLRPPQPPVPLGRHHAAAQARGSGHGRR